MLTPYRRADVNMSSVWECSRNDVLEGFAVIAAALAVWALGSGWPDIFVAAVLLVLFLRSATRVLRAALRDLRPAAAAS
jgi:Co/Zn/Cd efflux system component